MQQLNNILSVF